MQRRETEKKQGISSDRPVRHGGQHGRAGGAEWWRAGQRSAVWGAAGACSWLPPEVGGQAPSRLIAPILAAHRGCGCSQGHHPGNSGTTEHQQMSFRPRERLRARHVLAGELGGGDGEGPRSPPVLPVVPRWPQVVSESLLIFLRWEAFVSHPGRRRVDQEGADCAEPVLEMLTQD